jgi:hypothetical protein
VTKETTAFWGDKFIEILNPHKEGHIVRVYPNYWDEKAPSTWVSLTDEDIFGIFGTYRGDADYNHDQLLLDARRIEAKIKERNT